MLRGGVCRTKAYPSFLSPVRITPVNKKYVIIVLALGLLVSACASAPKLVRFPTESGAILYFFPMMEWKAEKGDIKAIVDISYRHENGGEAVCNISFANVSKSGTTPSIPARIIFSGDGQNYPLSNINELFVDAAKKLRRITSTTEGDNIIPLVKSRFIFLTASIDGTEYHFTPPGNFIKYRNLFLSEIGEAPAQ